MKKLLLALVLLSLLVPGLALGEVAYPIQYCNRGTNPTACTYASAATPLPVTLITTVGGATVAAMGATMAHASLGMAVRAGVYRYGTVQWEAVGSTTPLPVQVSADGSHFVGATYPLMVQLTSGTAAMLAPWAKADDDDGANEIAIDTVDADYTLPAAGWYDVTASGNSACIICGASPTAVMNTTCTIRVPESATRRLYLTGPKCSVIGPSATGYVYFLHLNPAL